MYFEAIENRYKLFLLEMINVNLFNTHVFIFLFSKNIHRSKFDGIHNIIISIKKFKSKYLLAYLMI